MQNRLIFLLALAMVYSAANTLEKQEQIRNEADTAKAVYKERPAKRNLIQFGVMILCTTGRNPLDYNLYGCWCGLGGSGIPVDPVDRCCQTHDRCYDKAVRDGTCPSSWITYFVYYKVKRCTFCVSEQGSCAQAICQCDSAAAKCFSRYKWNKKYYWYRFKPGAHC